MGALRAEAEALSGEVGRNPQRQRAMVLLPRDEHIAQLHGLIRTLHAQLAPKDAKAREQGGQDINHQLALLHEIEVGMLALLGETVLARPDSEEREQRRRELRKRIPKIIEQIQQLAEAKKAQPKTAKRVLPRAYFRVRRDIFRYSLTPKLLERKAPPEAKRAPTEDLHFQ